MNPCSPGGAQNCAYICAAPQCSVENASGMNMIDIMCFPRHISDACMTMRHEFNYFLHFYTFCFAANVFVLGPALFHKAELQI